MFRNLSLYRLPNGISATPEQLAEQLAKGVFAPCPPSARTSAGWVDPHPGLGLVYAQDGQRLLCLQTEDKILPSSYVARIAAEKAEELEEQQGYKPGRKQMRELRESIELELLPRAFTRLSRTLVWIDNKNGWMAIDGNSARQDIVIELLKLCMDMLPQMAIPHPKTAPGSAMTAWLSAGDAPDDFTIDRDCELRASVEEKATVKYLRSNLDTDEVRNHIAMGKHATRIAMTWADKVSFVLTDRLEIKRICLMDILKEDAARAAENGDDLFAANFTLYTGELAQVIAAVMESCGGEVQPMGDAK